MGRSLREHSRIATAVAVSTALILTGGGSLAALSAQADTAAVTALKPTDLRVAGQASDALVGSTHPTLAWAVQDSARGQDQTAYDVKVVAVPSDSGSDRTSVWDSGKVVSHTSTGLAYDGPALEADTTYEWSVSTWNDDDQQSPWSTPQRFDVGPLAVGDWSASWLQVADGALARSEFTLAKPVARARLYVGAQGIIEPHLNGAIVDPTEVLDSSSTDFATRVVYRDFDVTDQLKTGENVLGATLGKGSYAGGNPTFVEQLSVTYTDGTTATFGTDDSWTTSAGPVTKDDFYYGETYDARLAQTGWDTTGFNDSAWKAVPVFADVAGRTDLALKAPVTASDVLTQNGTTSVNGWSPAALTDGINVSTDGSEGFHSMVATDQNSAKWVQVDLGSSKAIGTITLYPAHPTNDAPGAPDAPAAGFPVRYQVQVSDDPTFASFTTFADKSASDQPSPGLNPVALDGTATGRYVRVAASKLYGSNNAYTLRFAELGVYAAGGTPVFGYTKLEADTTPPVRIIQNVVASHVTTPASGVAVYDFGLEYAGQVTITANAPSGTTVIVTKGEILDSNGRVSTKNISFADSDATRQKDTYIFDGSGSQTFTPALNYAGFRYAEISGVPAGTDITVTARVTNNDVAKTGSFTTSNALLNQIQAGLVRTQQNNLQQGMPLDCPTREKRGWMGDAGDTDVEAMANFDMQSLYDKWLGDVRTSQNADGSVPSVSPAQGASSSYFSEPAWGSAYPQIVWSSYEQYGDASVLTENYDQVKAWVDWMGTISTNNIINNSTPSWGDDWQAPVSTPHQYFQTGYYLMDAQLLAKIAHALGKTTDEATYTNLASAIATSFNAKYFDASSDTYAAGTQLEYALPLLLGIVPSGHDQAVLTNLVQNIRDRGNHVSTGYAGTEILYEALAKYNRNDVLLDIAERTDYPSFGYMVTTGPGTIWEKWVNSTSPDGTSSKSHIGLAGSIGQWYYQQLAGIQPGTPGYRSFTLAPAIVGDLTHVAASQQTVRGTISSEWTRTASDLTYKATIPVGSTATVKLPATSDLAVTEGGKALGDVDGVTVKSSDGTTVVLEVGSGSYVFYVSSSAEAAASAVDQANALSAQVADLTTSHDITDAAAATLNAPLTTAHDDSSAAASLLSSDVPAATAKVLSALDAARGLQAALAGTGISDTAVSTLTPGVAALVTTLTDLAAKLSGLTVAIDTGSTDSVLPGAAVDVAVTLTNTGTSSLGSVALALDLPDGWTGDGSIAVPDLAAGDSTTVHVHATVGTDQLPGALSVPLTVRFDYAGSHLNSVMPVPLTIGSASQIDSVAFDPSTVAPNSATTATVTVKNTGDRSVTGAVHVQVPSGWVVPLAAPTVTVPAGGSVTQNVRVFVPTTLDSASVPLTATFERSGVELAAKAGVVAAVVTNPTTALDHVDVGNTASETSHHEADSGDGGVTSEAGLTRRYSGAAANSYFQFDVAAPHGTPFVINAIETFDGAAPTQVKQYNVLVNGIVVQPRLFQRTANGAGTVNYQILVDDPAVLATTTAGTATVRFQHTANANYDPSIADLWTSTPPTSHPAPAVQAQVTAPDGSNDWFRSAPKVTVAGQDYAGTPVTNLEYRVDSADYSAYTAPVTVSGEGTHEVDVRGTANGVTSAVGSTTVKLDSAAPTTSGTQSGSPTATITLSATDATSGVAGTEYRIDGGAWTAYSSPFTVTEAANAQTISYRSTDVAGNVEQAQTLVVRAATVTPPPVTVAPTVTTQPAKSVSVKVGAKVTVSAAASGTPTPTIQWQSSTNKGKTWTDVAGQTSGSYVFTAKSTDTGRQLRAVFGNSAGTVYTTVVTLTVKKLTTSVSVSVKSVSHSKKAVVKVTVKPTSGKPTGTVTVHYGSHSKKATLKSSSKGVVKVTLPKLKKGKYKVSATYGGNSTYASVTSRKVTLAIR